MTCAVCHKIVQANGSMPVLINLEGGCRIAAVAFML